jgi:hypothetical protein
LTDDGDSARRGTEPTTFHRAGGAAPRRRRLSGPA